jgi:hypothetical protein
MRSPYFKLNLDQAMYVFGSKLDQTPSTQALKNELTSAMALYVFNIHTRIRK